MTNDTTRRILAAVAVITVTAAVSTSAGQSFDCRKATTAVEQMVCGDAALSRLDEQMARAFIEARTRVEATTIRQAAWLKDVRNRCTNVDCLNAAYERRITELGSMGRATPATGAPKQSPAAARSTDEWAGEWTRRGDTPNVSSSLTISNVTPAGFDFEMSASSGAHTGEIEGVAVRGAAGIMFKQEEANCEVRFGRRSGRVVVATSEGCASMGGMGVTFDGEYGKVNIATHEATLTELGVLAGTVTEDAFSVLVGADYRLFVSSFQLLSDEQDLDGLRAKVVTGSVRGMSTVVEAIVMSRSDGTILAAVIDGEVVKYFTNDAKFTRRLPATIDRWRERFSEKNVIFASVK